MGFFRCRVRPKNVSPTTTLCNKPKEFRVSHPCHTKHDTRIIQRNDVENLVSESKKKTRGKKKIKTFTAPVASRVHTVFVAVLPTRSLTAGRCGRERVSRSTCGVFQTSVSKRDFPRRRGLAAAMKTNKVIFGVSKTTKRTILIVNAGSSQWHFHVRTRSKTLHLHVFSFFSPVHLRGLLFWSLLPVSAFRHIFSSYVLAHTTRPISPVVFRRFFFSMIFSRYVHEPSCSRNP